LKNSRGGRSRSSRSGDWSATTVQWGGGVVATPVYALAAATRNATIVAGLVPAPATGTSAIPVGRQRLNEVEIYLDIPGASSSSGYANVGMGFCPVEYDIAAAAWTFRDPTAAVEAQRDDWIQLELATLFFNAGPSITQRGFTYQRRFKLNRELGSGEGIAFVIANAVSSIPTIYYNYFLRKRITMVS